MSNNIPEFSGFDPAEDPDFVLPENHKFTRTPEELLELLGRSAWEFNYANRKLRALQASISIRIPQVKIILLSRSVHLIQNAPLRAHLISCFEDPKFKFTGDILDAFIFVEQRELLTEKEKWEAITKQAEKEHEQWSKQLSFHQTRMRMETEEMKLSGVGKA